MGKTCFSWIGPLLILLACNGSAFSLDCPKAPEQVSKEWEVEVNAAVAKIGPIKGGDLATKTKRTTQDLLGKLPDAGRIYLEQMMFSAYCSALRDDKTLAEGEKAKRLNEYIIEVRKTINKAPASSGTKTKPTARAPQTESPALAATVATVAKRKLIIVMDSDANRTSMRQIVDLLSDFDKRGLVAIEIAPVTKDYRVDKFLGGKQPDLVIIHASAFYEVTSVDLFENYVIDFIKTIHNTSPNTEVLVYSGYFAEGSANGPRWLGRMRETYAEKVYGELVDPGFLERVDTIGFPHANEVSPEVGTAMRDKVVAILHLK
ncbi:MAG: hypothetical protein LAO22_19445 [Acidobacteriia bacterium]|nr:hypothetical protein [Terriglobia bacterium]